MSNNTDAFDPAALAKHSLELRIEATAEEFLFCNRRRGYWEEQARVFGAELGRLKDGQDAALGLLGDRSAKTRQSNPKAAMMGGDRGLLPSSYGAALGAGVDRRGQGPSHAAFERNLSLSSSAAASNSPGSAADMVTVRLPRASAKALGLLGE